MLAATTDFPSARVIDALTIAAAVAASIWGLALVTAPPDVAAFALLLPAGYVLLNAGQVVPFALVALVFCGVALARRRDRLAGLFAALTLIEPHLGLPVCVAMLCWVTSKQARSPRDRTRACRRRRSARRPERVTRIPGRVLPAQAAAETGYVYQYSLTYLLACLALPPMPALISRRCLLCGPCSDSEFGSAGGWRSTSPAAD